MRIALSCHLFVSPRIVTTGTSFLHDASVITRLKNAFGRCAERLQSKTLAALTLYSLCSKESILSHSAIEALHEDSFVLLRVAVLFEVREDQIRELLQDFQVVAKDWLGSFTCDSFSLVKLTGRICYLDRNCVYLFGFSSQLYSTHSAIYGLLTMARQEDRYVTILCDGNRRIASAKLLPSSFYPPLTARIMETLFPLAISSPNCPEETQLDNDLIACFTMDSSEEGLCEEKLKIE